MAPDSKRVMPVFGSVMAVRVGALSLGVERRERGR